jgi:hypothetical protein
MPHAWCISELNEVRVEEKDGEESKRPWSLAPLNNWEEASKPEVGVAKQISNYWGNQNWPIWLGWARRRHVREFFFKYYFFTSMEIDFLWW